MNKNNGTGVAGRWNPGTSPAAGGRVVYHQAECGGKRGEADDEGFAQGFWFDMKREHMMEAVAATIEAGLQSGVKGIANWWQEVNASPAWQENIFLGLAIAYAVIGLVALVSHLHPPPPPPPPHQHQYHRFFAPLDHLPPFIVALFLGLLYGLSLSLPLTEQVYFLVCSSLLLAMP
jgi:hypothetical protein